ncbi:tail fiber assembly protein [Erwinia pyrifoliae]|uniref:tail fiber assembly protein n=1 Tax=Erwinia pyrifoliae TaxID=79967 RepID=UPI002207D6CD|nr:tail fiber assembly protein [Erwinia pyrifoliae]MCT2387429.1 tail fiber assembly protein [Erwinia pyrifoliae]MCU8586971.1 tail fiber assembly protein [Erwinia pyrifoliae]UWS30839.1 tail fiber assembly protein [Erwinia pyrifoliae]
MKKYGIFKNYIPTPGTHAGALAAQFSAQFICDAQGNDWYELQHSFSDDTIKIVYDSAGVIQCASTDASTLWPSDACIAEINKNQLPKDFELPINTDGWQFDGKKIVPRAYTQEELQEKAGLIKENLLQLASDKIAPLRDAQELDIATDNEINELKLWMTYRVQINRIDITNAPNIKWPGMPDVSRR